MGRQAGEVRLRAFLAKQNTTNDLRGRKSNQAEAPKQQRMPRKQVNGTKHFGGQVAPALGERQHEPAPSYAILTQRGISVAQIALQRDRGTVVKGMRQRARRVNPFEPVIRQRQRGEKWRPGSQWMHRRSEVMEKAGQGELKRSGGASRLGLRFKNVHFPSTLSENDGPSETIGTGADDASLAAHLRFSLVRERIDMPVTLAV